MIEVAIREAEEADLLVILMSISAQALIQLVHYPSVKRMPSFSALRLTQITRSLLLPVTAWWLEPLLSLYG